MWQSFVRRSPSHATLRHSNCCYMLKTFASVTLCIDRFRISSYYLRSYCTVSFSSASNFTCVYFTNVTFVIAARTSFSRDSGVFGSENDDSLEWGLDCFRALYYCILSYIYHIRFSMMPYFAYIHFIPSLPSNTSSIPVYRAESVILNNALFGPENDDSKKNTCFLGLGI